MLAYVHPSELCHSLLKLIAFSDGIKPAGNELDNVAPEVSNR